MQYLKNIIIALIILLGLISFAQSETSWIKKKDKTETVKKVKKEKTTSWIKKKEVKENKKKLKEKIKESKSWITKKSKEKVKDIKNKLKKHKSIKDLPNADFYFTAVVLPKDENEQQINIYGYFDGKWDQDFTFNNDKFSPLNEGIAYFENKKNSCEVNVKQGNTFNLFIREIILNCKNFDVEGSYANKLTIGIGDGVSTGGNNVVFEITNNKNQIAKIFEKNKSKILPRTMLTQGDSSVDDNLLDLEITGKYYALLIGNSNYAKYANWKSLNSPKNDVLEIEKVLKQKYKFERVITAIDATKKEMEDKLNELAEITTDKDYVLIYYSGHGEKKSNSTYWIPIDGPKKWKYGSWVSISEIGNLIENINAHHLVLMVDSCYTGSSFKGVNDTNLSTKSYNHFKQLAQKLINRRARYVLSSGGNEPVDDTDDGKHSIFAKSFLNSLNSTEVINMETIWRRIDLALAEADLDQRPYFYSPEVWGHGGGDFIFVAKK